jgi:hypothetical protein
MPAIQLLLLLLLVTGQRLHHQTPLNHVDHHHHYRVWVAQQHLDESALEADPWLAVEGAEKGESVCVRDI